MTVQIVRDNNGEEDLVWQGQMAAVPRAGDSILVSGYGTMIVERVVWTVMRGVTYDVVTLDCRLVAEWGE